MWRQAVIAVALSGLATTTLAQQNIVFPAVANEVEGLNGSQWVTVARFIKVDPRDSVTIRRKWVCLPGGGFLEDQEDPVTYHLPEGSGWDRIVMPWGDGLLVNTDAHLGAVGYEVQGGGVLAHSYVVDVSRGEHEPWYYSAGQGQFVKALEDPIEGPSHIPWLGGCRNSPCSGNYPGGWDFHRNNIGFVNPNPETLTITATMVPFTTHDAMPRELTDRDPETFVREVPPFGWLQFHWESDRDYGSGPFGDELVADGGFVISLTPDKDIAYYAYASVVFSPDPDSDNQMFSDPMFVPAEPGYVAPHWEVYPPKSSEE